jgi:hypothetical protein
MRHTISSTIALAKMTRGQEESDLGRDWLTSEPVDTITPGGTVSGKF